MISIPMARGAGIYSGGRRPFGFDIDGEGKERPLVRNAHAFWLLTGDGVPLASRPTTRARRRRAQRRMRRIIERASWPFARNHHCQENQYLIWSKKNNMRTLFIN